MQLDSDPNQFSNHLLTEDGEYTFNLLYFVRINLAAY